MNRFQQLTKRDNLSAVFPCAPAWVAMHSSGHLCVRVRRVAPKQLQQEFRRIALLRVFHWPVGSCVFVWLSDSIKFNGKERITIHITTLSSWHVELLFRRKRLNLASIPFADLGTLLANASNDQSP